MNNYHECLPLTAGEDGTADARDKWTKTYLAGEKRKSRWKRCKTCLKLTFFLILYPIATFIAGMALGEYNPNIFHCLFILGDTSGECLKDSGS